MCNNELQGRKFSKACEILEKYEHNPSKLIPILQEVQEEYRYLPEEIMGFIATSLKLSPAKVFGVATFYTHFAFKPKGKHIIRICDGTACHVRKSEGIKQSLQSYLGVNDENNTSSDMMFSLEIVSCLGACGLAPVVVIDEEVHGQMTPEKTLQIIKSIKSREEQCV